MMLLPLSELPLLIERAAHHGLMPRFPDTEAFARDHRVVLLRHEESEIEVDLSLGLLPFEAEVIQRSQKPQLGDLLLPLPTPEDLIILKAVAHRPKDMEDVRSLLTTHPALDRDRIRRQVQQFAALLDAPEIWTDLTGLDEWQR